MRRAARDRYSTCPSSARRPTWTHCGGSTNTQPADPRKRTVRTRQRGGPPGTPLPCVRTTCCPLMSSWSQNGIDSPGPTASSESWVGTYVRTYFRHRGLGGLGLGLGNTGGLRVTCTYQRETTTYVAALPTESTDVRRQHPREESGFYILSGLWLDTYVRIWNLAGRLSEVRIAQ